MKNKQTIGSILLATLLAIGSQSAIAAETLTVNARIEQNQQINILAGYTGGKFKKLECKLKNLGPRDSRHNDEYMKFTVTGNAFHTASIGGETKVNHGGAPLEFVHWPHNGKLVFLNENDSLSLEDTVPYIEFKNTHSSTQYPIVISNCVIEK